MDGARREQVLLMESRENQRKLTLNILKYLGFEVTEAVNCIDVLKKYNNQLRRTGCSYDAVIMDSGSGSGSKNHRLVDKLKRIDPKAKTLMLTGPVEIESLSRELLKHLGQ